jgi:hypothetical protein
MEKKQTLSIRQRGYLPADASSEIIIIYENDVEPLNPDGSVMKKIWDNDVVTHTVIKPHVETP